MPFKSLLKKEMIFKKNIFSMDHKYKVTAYPAILKPWGAIFNFEHNIISVIACVAIPLLDNL